MPAMRGLVVSVISAFVALSCAQTSISRLCPNAESDICYGLNIPNATAQSGTGDIYFAITAPTRYEWVALGQGSKMPDSNVWVVYTSSDGQDVTVSYRPTAVTKRSKPHYSATGADFEVLTGSGVRNGTMTALIRCSNCHSWNNGTMNFDDDHGHWIYAQKTGIPIASNDLNIDIPFHDVAGSFQWPFASARGGNSTNPFMAPDATVMSTTSKDLQLSETKLSGRISRVREAHGVLASLTFVTIFPVGGILIRVTSFPGLIWVHAALQMLGWLMWIAAFGMGLWVAKECNHEKATHAIVGYAIFAFFLIQPVAGWMHHVGFVKARSRNFWSHCHMSIGRAAIILGIVNGGLGLHLAKKNTSDGRVKAYIFFAVVVGVVYIGVAVWAELKRYRNFQLSRKSDSVGLRETSKSFRSDV